MKDCEIYRLEDNHDYLVVYSFDFENSKYKALSEINNHRNICIRKIINENNKEYLSRLEEDEYDRVINYLANNYKNLFE